MQPVIVLDSAAATARLESHIFSPDWWVFVGSTSEAEKLLSLFIGCYGGEPLLTPSLVLFVSVPKAELPIERLLQIFRSLDITIIGFTLEDLSSRNLIALDDYAQCYIDQHTEHTTH